MPEETKIKLNHRRTSVAGLGKQSKFSFSFKGEK